MRTRLISSFSAVSLLLCAATVLIWIRFDDERRTFIHVTNRFAALIQVKGGMHFESTKHGPGLVVVVDRYWGWGGFHYATVDNDYQFAVIPYWFPTLVLLIMPALSLCLYLRRRRLRQFRDRNGLCSSCGYDLRASPDRCPECGSIPPPAP